MLVGKIDKNKKKIYTLYIKCYKGGEKIMERNELKAIYRDYIFKIDPYINWVGVCKDAGIHYTNFRKFKNGDNSYVSLEKLKALHTLLVQKLLIEIPKGLKDKHLPG